MAPEVSAGVVRRPVSKAYGAVVTKLRWLVVLAWIAATAAATVLLPSITSVGGQAVGDLVPANAPAIRAEQLSFRLFGIPVLSRIAIVQRDPEGLSAAAQARVYTRAVGLLGERPAAEPGTTAEPIGGLPITNTGGLFPGSRESSTAAVTFLFFDPDTSLEDQVDGARAYADREINAPDDALVGVTGAIPARIEQGNLILDALPLVEAASVALVALILALYFRSVGAPLVTLAAAGIAYLISIRVVAWAGEGLGIVLPKDLEPVIVVLLLGIVTDYSIFFLSGFRDRVAAGEPRLLAAKHTTADFVHIIVTAGLIVAAGTAALIVASVDFLRSFGPALALTVLVSLMVSISLIPSLLAIFGRGAFWPRRFAVPEATDAAVDSATARVEEPPRGWRWSAVRMMTRRPIAVLVIFLCLLGLGAAASGLSRADLGFTLISGLPEENEVSHAAREAQLGFADGILSPTEVLVLGEGLDQRGAELDRLHELVGGEPGVAGVIGSTLELQELAEGLTVTEDGRAARFVIILGHDPLGGDGIATLNALQSRMPDLLREAGLSGVRVSYAGDTALADQAVSQMLTDLQRVALAALAISLILLVLFLRGLIAPLFLLASSALGLAAALGLTTYVFQGALGRSELTYYVPFGAAVLLLSLGSDYNVFVVGRIWDEARGRTLRDAISIAAPRAARTITIAGVVLAASFAALALVPLVEFREFAFALAVGVLLDTFVIRSLLVPALISLFGRFSWWPGRGPRSDVVAPGRAEVAAPT
jgi:putative drug exporter of the RND superfamily